MAHPIRGMESVIATVSGYHGIERFKLIKLIALTGAHYVGAMAKSTTHLVCWQFEGNKYDLAKNLGTHIVSHRWFEDCLNEGKRLPEGPYTMKSGQQEGPISWEVPAFLDISGKKGCVQQSERSMLSDQSNMTLCAKEVNTDSGSNVGYSKWSSTDLIDEPEESGLYSSLCSSRRRKGLLDDVGSSICGKSLHKSRRLVKKNAPSNHLNCVMLDGEQECCLAERSEQQDDIISESTDLNNVIKGSFTPFQQISTDNLSLSSGQGTIQGLEVTDYVAPLNNAVPVDSNNSRSSCLLAAHGTSSHDMCTELVEGNNYCDIKDNQNERMEDIGDQGELVKLRSSVEVSCVICWTDFCSTRGVLSCGHRFCYTCIQDWADCMASKGKVSTCPLCKASFNCITKVEGSALLDQKVYSQTIPCGSSDMDVLMLPDRDKAYGGASVLDSVCYDCHNHEPEDLLLSCHLCQERWVHSCCLDPPLVPWTCIHCRDLRMLYQRFR